MLRPREFGHEQIDAHRLGEDRAHASVKTLPLAFAQDVGETFETTWTKIQNGIANRNPSSLASAAHTLRGTVALFSAEKGVELTRNLEIAAQASNWAEVATLQTLLAAEMKVLMASLGTLTSNEISPSNFSS